MKKFNKLFIILLCCVGAMSVTSCLSDDDGGGLSDEVRAQYYNAINGFYYGGATMSENRIYFYNDTIEKENKIDSIARNIAITFAARDSSFMISGVPGRVLAKEIKDEKYKELKEAIENQPAQTIRGKFWIQDASGNNALLYYYPTSLTFKGLKYGGAEHDITIAFLPVAAGNWWSANTQRSAQIPIFVAAIFEGEKQIITIYDGREQNDEKYYRSLLDIRAFE